jgi:rRNA maturation RNase YbeY
MECGTAGCTILFCDDSEIEALNLRWRGRPDPTDVLAFPSGDPPGDGIYLGDIAISVDTARRQGSRRGRSLEAEIHRLIVHGFLHLLGFDHETDDGQMRRREQLLWRQWRERVDRPRLAAGRAIRNR